MNRPLAPLTSFRVGGRAAAYLPISDPAELVAVVKLARANQLPYLVFAGGSNVIFPDGEVAKLVIRFYQNTNKCVVMRAGKTALEVPAGLALKSLIASSIGYGLAGLEALAGIPGTVGGALVGNAGAYGQSISDRLVAVQIWDGERVRWLKKRDCRFKYRESIFKTARAEDWLILRAKFQLKAGNKKELLRKSRQIIRTRLKRYPKNLQCPGSFFKNVLLPNGEKIVAGKLLEQVGACGMRSGAIRVSDWHGNLIVNDGGGTARDVRKLARILKNKVARKFGIRLEEEVRYLC